MAAVLVLLLLLHAAPARAQEAPGGRLLVLPDVTLSAEDPLFLAVPAALDWTLQAPAQPPVDRRRLWAVEAPPRIRALQEPLLPMDAPGSRPSFASRPAVAAPGALPPSAAGAATGAAPAATTAAGRTAGRQTEAGLRLIYRTTATAGLDLWVDRRRSVWETTAGSALTLSDELPSWFELRAGAALQLPAWRAELQVEGAGLLRPQGRGSLGGDFSGSFKREPAPWGLELAARLLAEQPAGAGDAWLLLSQGITGTWHGEHWGLQAGGLGFAAMGRSPELRGLTRLELEWAGSALTVSAGAALMAGAAGLQPYPEAAVEVRPFRPLALRAGLSAYLDQPAPFLVREAFGGGGRVEILPTGGLQASFAAVLDAPGTGGIRIGLRAFEGESLLLRDGLLSLQTDPHLTAEVLARLALNPEQRRLRLTVSVEGFAALPLPVTAQAFGRLLYTGLGAGLQVGFAKWPAELILQGRWGDAPVESLPALLAERQAGGWQASLAVRWKVRPPLSIQGGFEAGAAPGVMAGCILQARRSP